MHFNGWKSGIICDNFKKDLYFKDVKILIRHFVWDFSDTNNHLYIYNDEI